jgi:mannose-6-phosphate isomerase-like protein (cupin superfamily)
MEKMSDYTIVNADEVRDFYEGTDVPGEFRRLTKDLPHSDFEQSTGHYHDEIEEIYIITRGTLTMRFGDEIKKVSAGSVVRVAPKTPRSHRNEGDEPVDMWAISIQLGRPDYTKIDKFWKASDKAKQTKH